jgi:hypothetical protein
LGVNDDQASKLQDVSEDVTRQRNEMMNPLGSDLRRNDLSPQDREQLLPSWRRSTRQSATSFAQSWRRF